MASGIKACSIPVFVDASAGLRDQDGGASPFEASATAGSGGLYSVRKEFAGATVLLTGRLLPAAATRPQRQAAQQAASARPAALQEAMTASRTAA